MQNLWSLLLSTYFFKINIYFQIKSNGAGSGQGVAAHVKRQYKWLKIWFGTKGTLRLSITVISLLLNLVLSNFYVPHFHILIVTIEKSESGRRNTTKGKQQGTGHRVFTGKERLEPAKRKIVFSGRNQAGIRTRFSSLSLSFTHRSLNLSKIYYLLVLFEQSTYFYMYTVSLTWLVADLMLHLLWLLFNNGFSLLPFPRDQNCAVLDLLLSWPHIFLLELHSYKSQVLLGFQLCNYKMVNR